MKKIKIFIKLVKFEHTIFALPFAYMGMICANKAIPSAKYWILVTLAMVFARTAGMAFNRLIDRNIDARNPRTKNRALVKNEISRVKVKLIILISLIGLFITSANLNLLCLLLSPFAVVLLLGYSYFKRFTCFCHLALGMVLACAPIGGWISVDPKINLAIILLALAVAFWVTGFDIIYAILDIEFDKKEGLFSIPKKMGIKKALLISRICHLVSILFFVLFGITYAMAISYWVGVILTSILLVDEQSIISSKDFSRVNQSFFVVNGSISVLLFIFTVIAYKI